MMKAYRKRRRLAENGRFQTADWRGIADGARAVCNGKVSVPFSVVDLLSASIAYYQPGTSLHLSLSDCFL